MGGHTIGGGTSEGFTEDTRKLHMKVRALNAAPEPDVLENAEAVFDLLEKAAGIKRRRSRAVFWGGYIVGSLFTSFVWWYF